MNVPSWPTYRATTMRSKELNRLTMCNFKNHKFPTKHIITTITMWLNRSTHTAHTIKSDQIKTKIQNSTWHIQEKSFDWLYQNLNTKSLTIHFAICFGIYVCFVVGNFRFYDLRLFCRHFFVCADFLCCVLPWKALLLQFP